MTEIDALLKTAISTLAGIVVGIGTVAWLALLFKSTSANQSINHLADVVELWLKREKDKTR